MYIKTYLVALTRDKQKHPCYLECEKHFTDKKVISGLFSQVCFTMEKKLTNKENNKKIFTADYLRKVVSSFKPDIENFTIQRNILDAILCYAKNNYQLDSPKVPNLFELKRDKPILTPGDLIKARLAQRVYDLLQQEVITPNIHLNPSQKLGRLVLFLYLKESVQKFNEISKLLTIYSFNYISHSICLTDNEPDTPKLRRYVLTGTTALFFMQFRSDKTDFESHRFTNARLLKSVNDFLTHASDDAGLKFTTSQLRLCRKIYYSLHFSPSEAYFYTGTLASSILPDECFTRILTGHSVIRKSAISKLTKSTGITVLRNQMQKGKVTSQHYESIESCHNYLKKVYETIKQMGDPEETDKSLTLTRNNIIHQLDDKLKTKELQTNGCLWLLVSWARSLLRNGGLGKVKLRSGTIIDYVNTLAIPFLNEFLEHDLFLISGPEWAEKLNLVAEKINSPTRRSFVYFFAHYLEQIDFIADFSLSDIDITNGSSRVDANLISIEHAEDILDFIGNSLHLLSLDAELLFCLCFYSGLRRNEAAYLRLSDFEILEGAGIRQMIINLSVRNHRGRKLKSTSSHRLLPLTELWPKKMLDKLYQRLIFLDDKTLNSTKYLFNDQSQVTLTYALISNVMRDYTGDSQLRIHHLRHSFANWQFFRLMISTQTSIDKTQLPSFLQHDYLSIASSLKLKKHLGLKDNSRKTVFVLSSMMGHQDVSTTLASYVHLRDVFHYIIMAKESAVTQKIIDRVVGRSLGNDIGKILTPKLNQSVKKAEKLSRLSLKFEGKVFPKPLNMAINSFVPIFSPIEYKHLPKIKVKAVTAAALLRSMEIYDVQTVSLQNNIDKAWIEALNKSAVYISQNYPRRGKKFPIYPNFPKSKEELPNNKSLSQSRVAFESLCTKYDDITEKNRISHIDVEQGLKIMSFAIPGKGYLFRCTDPNICSDFLFLCNALGLLNRHLSFKLYYLPVNNEFQLQSIENRWDKMIKDSGYIKTNIPHAKKSESLYLGNKAINGALEIKINHTKLKSNKKKRVPVFFNFLHLILILNNMEIRV